MPGMRGLAYGDFVSPAPNSCYDKLPAALRRMQLQIHGMLSSAELSSTEHKASRVAAIHGGNIHVTALAAIPGTVLLCGAAAGNQPGPVNHP